jgi:hypothetical protein
MDPMKNENPKNAEFPSASSAADQGAHTGKKAPWSKPTLTRLPGEETEAVEPSLGIVKFLIAGS